MSEGVNCQNKKLQMKNTSPNKSCSQDRQEVARCGERVRVVIGKMEKMREHAAGA
jgi:hypothetical protein